MDKCKELCGCGQPCIKTKPHTIHGCEVHYPERSIDLKQFDYHPPTGDQPERYKKLVEGCKDFASLIDECCPDSREKSLAITNLEQSRMWASASIAKSKK